jgi:uncharacterized membrane protein SpoIIM required for sporulation
VVNLLLVRTGIQLFNREELLGREIDELNLLKIGRSLVHFWRRIEPEGPAERVTLGRIYRHDVPAIGRRLRLPVCVVLLGLLAAGLGGAHLAGQYALPPSTFDPTQLSLASLQKLPGGFLPLFSGWILFHNLRALSVSALLAIFSFGSIAIVTLMAPVGIIGFMAAQFAHWGQNPWQFLAVFILPHGLFEFPAAILVASAALRLGATIVTRRARLTVSESWLSALVDLVKIFLFVALPLLTVAAIIEVYLTPQLVVWIYGR